MKAISRLAAILYLVCLINLLEATYGLTYPDYCRLEVTSSKGIISTQKCDLNVANVINDTIGSSVDIRNTVTRWSVMNEAPDRLMLGGSFAAKGEGSLKVTLMTTPKYNRLFCGKISLRRTDDLNSTAVINFWLKCDQHQLKLDDKMTLFIDKDTTINRRDVPVKVNVDLPGCTLPEFKNTELCAIRKEQKIRFHVRRVPDRASIRVTLSPAAYKSKYEDKRRAKGRRYYVSIKEEQRGDDWSSPGEGGKTVQYTQLSWPKRKVRFRLLRLKKTYDVVVWRRGEVKKYVKKITLC